MVRRGYPCGSSSASTLRFMTADELNAYADAHPDWLAHRPYSTGQVRVEACAGRYL